MPQPKPKPPAGDPVELDPKHYTVEFENDRVRVLRVKYGPHEKSVMHRHPATLSIALTGRDWKITLPDGGTRNIIGRPGEIIWYEPHEHLPENLSFKPYEGFAIELKDK
jgi:quercetin dioxygenase-like cupin family protein